MPTRPCPGPLLLVLLASCGGATLGSPGSGGTGAIGGRMESGGTGGTIGWGDGIGGTTGICAVRPNAPACPAVCGNGIRDTCSVNPVTCPPIYATETCDGTDFGSESCRARGFVSGSLACAADCGSIDDSACGKCQALDASLVRCGKAPLVTTNPGPVPAIAATDTGVGIAWLDFLDENVVTASFARLSPALDRVGVTVLDDRAPPAPAMPDYVAFDDIAVAALPSGWVVVLSGPTEVSVRALGPDGVETGRAVVDRRPVVEGHAYPWLAAQPSGGPLLVLMTDTAMRAMVISADGRSATTPVDLPTRDVAGYSGPTAAFASGSFHVVYAIESQTREQTLRFVGIGSDGRLGGVVDAPPEMAVWTPNLVVGANDLRVAYLGGALPNDQMTWRRFSAAGAPLTQGVALDPQFLVFGPAYAFGDDTVAFVIDGDVQSLSYARIALDGRIVTPAREIARSPYFVYAGARRGPDLVVAWLDELRELYVARVTP